MIKKVTTTGRRTGDKPEIFGVENYRQKGADISPAGFGDLIKKEFTTDKTGIFADELGLKLVRLTTGADKGLNGGEGGVPIN